eukprot:COSAG06_NODE_19038_length_856_cov_1.433289_1_plen_41_part_10
MRLVAPAPASLLQPACLPACLPAAPRLRLPALVVVLSSAVL